MYVCLSHLCRNVLYASDTTFFWTWRMKSRCSLSGIAQPFWILHNSSKPSLKPCEAKRDSFHIRVTFPRLVCWQISECVILTSPWICLWLLAALYLSAEERKDFSYAIYTETLERKRPKNRNTFYWILFSKDLFETCCIQLPDLFLDSWR